MENRKLPQPLFTENGSKAVLLLHAYSGSSTDVRMMSRYLEKENYTVYSPIFSGHGTWEPEDILKKNTADWNRDTHEAIGYLKNRGYSQVAVLGLSLGGILAMNSLTENITGLIGGGFFCSPIFPVANNVVKNFNIYAEKQVTCAKLSKKEKEHRLATIYEASIQQLADIETFSRTTASKLSNVQVPIFMAQAGQDEMIETTGIYQTAQALAHTRFTLNWYPKSRHVITVGPEHKQLEQDVVTFLASLSWNEEIT